MRKIYRLSIFIALLVIVVSLLVGCETPPKSEPNEDSKDVELKEITDPDGIVLTINTMPLTKAELEKWVKKIAPGEDYGISKAFQGYFIPNAVIEDNFADESAELILELEKIKAEIVSGEISFEDAVMKYSDDPSKEETNGFTEFYAKGLSFYSVDEALDGIAEGEITDPVATPMGSVILKLEKEHFDLDGARMTTDIRQIILTFGSVSDETDEFMVKMEELIFSVEIDLLDEFLLKEMPHLDLMGKDKTAEEAEAFMKKMEEMEVPENDWRDIDPDIVVAKVGGRDITAGRLKEVMLGSMPPENDILNVVINRVLLPRLAKIGYLKEHHETALNKLSEIKDQILNEEMTFEEAQIDLSDDPGKKTNLLYEDIGYDMFIPEFEGIMFDIPFNEISEPFLSEYGVHILLVEDAVLDDEGNRETVNVRHILLDWKQFIDPEGTDDNAMYKLNLNYQKDVDIQVFDARLQAMLPGLGKKEEEKEDEVVEEAEENEVDEAEDTESDETDD